MHSVAVQYLNFILIVVYVTRSRVFYNENILRRSVFQHL